MIPGAIFRLVSFFVRRNAAFQNEPVNKVRHYQIEIKTFWHIIIFVQICEQHYQKLKKCLDNKHALQALPGGFSSGDIGGWRTILENLPLLTLEWWHWLTTILDQCWQFSPRAWRGIQLPRQWNTDECLSGSSTARWKCKYIANYFLISIHLFWRL